MQPEWTYKNHEIKEGLKPGSKTFRYFFKVLEKGEKKCNFCVWIMDDALYRFDLSKDFDTIVTSQNDTWKQWVKGKIDNSDFRNRALKIDTSGQVEINLSEMSTHVSAE